MPFRRNSQKTRRWDDWLATHRDELSLTGVPAAIFENERYWFYFLEHGACHGHGDIPSFHLGEITATEAPHLLSFLRAHAQIKHSDAERELARSYPDLGKSTPPSTSWEHE